MPRKADPLLLSKAEIKKLMRKERVTKKRELDPNYTRLIEDFEGGMLNSFIMDTEGLATFVRAKNPNANGKDIQKEIDKTLSEMADDTNSRRKSLVKKLARLKAIKAKRAEEIKTIAEHSAGDAISQLEV